MVRATTARAATAPNGSRPQTLFAKILARHAAEAEARKPAAPWGFWTIEIENLASELKGERALLKQQADQLAQPDSSTATTGRGSEIRPGLTSGRAR